MAQAEFLCWTIDDADGEANFSFGYDDETGLMDYLVYQNLTDDTIYTKVTDPTDDTVIVNGWEWTLDPGTERTQLDVSELGVSMVQKTSQKTGLTGWVPPYGWVVVWSS